MGTTSDIESHTCLLDFIVVVYIVVCAAAEAVVGVLAGRPVIVGELEEVVHADGVGAVATLHHLLLHGDLVLDLGAVGADLHSAILSIHQYRS